MIMEGQTFDIFVTCIFAVVGTAVAQCVLQIERSLFQSQMVSLEFFIDIILPMALWPWVRLSL